MSNAAEVQDIAEYSPERVAELVAQLELHIWPGHGDRCAECGQRTPCPPKYFAERTLFLIGYMRSTDRRHELRDLTDYVRWLGPEIEFREALPADHPQYAAVLDSLPLLRDRLADSRARLLAAAESAFPDSAEGTDGHETATVR